MRTFDPRTMGGAECAAWAAYYRHEWRTALRNFLTLVREGFALSGPRTLLGAWWVLRANQVWAPYPDNDPDSARYYMLRFYRLVKAAHGERFDPMRAAQLEVEWWRVHRDLQREEGTSETLDSLVDALQSLYAFVYDVPPDAVRDAARLRAEAMLTSDQWVRDGCGLDDPALVRERDQLVASYAALRDAVGTGGPPARA